MISEEILENFLKSLRTAITNSSVYFKEHPMFISSAETLRDKIYDVFEFSNPFDIGITPKSLWVEGKYLEKNKLYVEIAEFFHLRKIKNIKIRRGLTTEELVDFLMFVALAPKEILKNGGLSVLLHTASILHVSVEELDYSELLKGEGQAYKDIWVPLLQGALKKGSERELDNFADNFDKITSEFTAKDFAQNPEINTNVTNFLNYLKVHSKDKFYKCSKRVIKSFLTSKDPAASEALSKFEPFINDLSKEEFSSMLCDDLLDDGGFDALNFQLFAKFTAKKDHRSIAASLADGLASGTKDKQKLIKKIKELFSMPQDSPVGEIYYRALSKFIEESMQDKGYYFDRDLLSVNYRISLVNILVVEAGEERLRIVCEKISQVLDNIDVAKNAEYIKNVLTAIEIQRKNLPLMARLFETLEKKVCAMIEKAVLEGQLSLDTDYFIRFIKKSSFNIHLYLSKIFSGKKIDPYILKLFFKLFSRNLDVFYKEIRKHSQDTGFLKNILDNLRAVDSLVTLDIIKYIFSFADSFIRMEALRAMQELSFVDKDFLFTLIGKGDFLLRKQALLVLAKNNSTKEAALQALLGIANPFGIHNKILMENLKIIDEADLKEAQVYLQKLSTRRFFWNNNVRRYARDILRRFNPSQKSPGF